MTKRNNRLLSLLTVLSLAAGSLTLSGAAAPQNTAAQLLFQPAEAAPHRAEIAFDEPISGTDGYLTGAAVKAFRGEAANEAGVAERNGRTCWEIAGSAGQEEMFLYLNVDDFYLQNKDLSLVVSVDYLDEGTGSFLIQYDQYNTNFAAGMYANSDTVALTGSGEWKTAEFVLNHAYLMNRQAIKGKPAEDTPYKRTADLRLRAASGQVAVSGIVLREAVEIDGVNPDFIGNIFTTADAPAIPLTLTNSTGAEDTFTVECTAETSRGDPLAAYAAAVTIPAGSAAQAEVQLPSGQKGAFVLRVRVTDSAGRELAAEKIPYSIVTPKSHGVSDDPYFGVQTHLVRKVFEDKPGVVDSILRAAELSGAQLIRDEMYWGMAEPQKDNFVFLPHWERYVDTALANGMQPSIILSYGNELYREEDEGGTPTPGTDAQIAAFANYAREMAEHYKGRVKQYEVWNEWNGGMNNRPAGNASGIKYFADVYTRLLQATYTALKSVDPEIRVVGCVSAGANPFYVESVVAAGGLDYMDAVSYHPYDYPSVPDRMATEVSTFEGLRKLGAILKRYGSEKPLIISEQGWPSFTANQPTNVAVPERYQASYISRLFTLGLAYGADQVYIYDLQDDGTYGGREQNFGMIEHWYGDEVPFAAKESFVAMNNLTTLLDGAEFVREYSVNQDLRAYQFVRPSDNKDVVVLWGVYNGSTVRCEGTTAGMTAYDLFGNECPQEFVGPDPVFWVGDHGSFRIDEVVTDRWYTVSADASHNIAGMDKTNGTYYAGSYLSSAPWYEGLTLETAGGFGVPEFILRGERKGWLLGTGEYQDDTIYANVDDSYLCAESAAVKIRIEYFDEKAGEFYLWYDGGSGDTIAGAVELTGSHEWKEAEFLVEDAWFGNRLNGADLRLSLQNGSHTGIDSLVFGRLEVERVSARFAPGSAENGGIKLAGDSPAVEETAGRPAIVLSGSSRAGFAVDDKFLFGGETQIELTVEYYDSDEQAQGGYGFFQTACDGASGGTVTLTGTNQWKKAAFSFGAARLCGLEPDGADFSVAADAANGTASPVPVRIGRVELRRIKPFSAHATLGEAVESEYLEAMPSGNAGFATTPAYYSKTAGKEVGTIQTNKAQNSPNLFLLVNDEFLYDTDVTAELTITYWDEGTGNLVVNYDGTANKNAAVTKANAFTNTKDFKTITVSLPHARFYNRRAQKSDIQITRGAGNLAVSELTLRVAGASAPVPPPVTTDAAIKLVLGETTPAAVHFAIANTTPDAAQVELVTTTTTSAAAVVTLATGPTIRAISGVVTMDTTPPGPVVNLRATPADSGAYLAWDNPEDGFATNATMEELRVYQKQPDDSFRLVNYKMDSPANNQEGKSVLFYVGGLENGTEYTFRVTATDKWLNESDPTEITVTPVAGTVSAAPELQASVVPDGMGGSICRIAAEVGNTSSQPTLVSILMASYDAENRMSRLWEKQVVTAQGTGPHTLESTFYLDGPLPEGGRLRAFLWDGLDSLHPLANAADLAG